MTADQKHAIEPWLGVLAAPVIFLINLQLNFSIVGWVCATNQYWAIHVAHVVALILTVGSGWLAWRTWERTGRTAETEGPGSETRERFLGLLGLLTAALIALALIAHWIPNFLLGACQ